MQFISILLSISIVLPSAIASMGLFIGSAEAAGSSIVHPWEFHQRRVHHRTLPMNYDELYDFYYHSPQRSITHGLHPINRRRYYNSKPYVFLSNHGTFGSYTDVEVYEYDGENGHWVRGGEEPPLPARGSDCVNYSFKRPNYRVPPFGYRCMEEEGG